MTIQTDMAGTAIVLSESDTVIAGLRADNAGMVDEISALRAEVAALKVQVAGARRDHESDIRIIGEALIDEAERRDWCGVFDDTVSDLNARLVVALPERERDYEITVSGTLTVPFTHTVTVTLSGRHSESDINDAAREAMEGVDATDLNIDLYGVDVDEWEVEDVNEA